MRPKLLQRRVYKSTPHIINTNSKEDLLKHYRLYNTQKKIKSDLSFENFIRVNPPSITHQTIHFILYTTTVCIIHLHYTLHQSFVQQTKKQSFSILSILWVHFFFIYLPLSRPFALSLTTPQIGLLFCYIKMTIIFRLHQRRNLKSALFYLIQSLHHAYDKKFFGIF